MFTKRCHLWDVGHKQVFSQCQYFNVVNLSKLKMFSSSVLNSEMCVHTHMWMWVEVCMCVCVFQRKTDRDRERQRQRDVEMLFKSILC